MRSAEGRLRSLRLADEMVGVCELLTEALGTLHDPAEYARWVEEGTAAVWALRVGEELVGGCTARTRTDYDEKAWGPGWNGLLASGSAGLLESGALRPERRRQGLGSQLYRVRLRWLEALGCSWALAQSWVGSPSPSLPVLERYGFRPLFYRPRAWEGDDCPVCGPQACRCGAVMLGRRL